MDDNPTTLRQIDSNTRYCALIGYPVRHSASPAFQNAGMTAMGLNWRYLALEVCPENFSAAVAGAKSMGFIGLNLTVPHKESAFKLVDEVSESAQILKSINTIKFEGLNTNGNWQPIQEFQNEYPKQIKSIGYNTDADAIPKAIKEELNFDFSHSKILILGAGGAGRVAALRIAKEGIDTLYIVNRTQEKAERLRHEISQYYPMVNIKLGYPEATTKIDIIINATSLGLKSNDPLPCDLSSFSFKQTSFAFDMIYRPSRTPFLIQAENEGCKIANGMNMLLYQGVESLKIWSGKAVPVEIMRKALTENIYPKQS